MGRISSLCTKASVFLCTKVSVLSFPVLDGIVCHAGARFCKPERYL